MEITLQKLFGEEAWGTHQPARLTDLMNAEYDSLDEKARGLRALAVQLVHSFERQPVHTASDARSMLENHHLPARKNKWCAVALDSACERNYVRAEKGAMRLNHTVSTSFFSADKLNQKAPLPEGGKYLIIFGGSPSALSENDVAQELSDLRKELTIADVIFWDVSEDSAVFYSVGAGVGQRGRELLEFPDPDALEKARTV